MVRFGFTVVASALLLLALGLPWQSISARTIPQDNSVVYIQTNGPRSQLLWGDWYTPVENGVGAGYHYFEINVPCGWPRGEPVYVDLFSPEVNTQSAIDEIEYKTPDNTIFELYAPGAKVTAVNQPGPGTSGSLVQTIFPPESNWPEQWIRFATIAEPTVCGQYLLRAETQANDQNGWRLRVGRDNDQDPTNQPPANIDNPDGIAGTGDELTVGMQQAAYQHNVQNAAQCLTFYQYVAPGLDAVAFHNFDFDNNERIRYYSPGDASYDPQARFGGILGEVSGFIRWNSGTATERGPGDIVTNPKPGWWRMVACVRHTNQFIVEGQLGVPIFLEQPPEPDLLITKDDGQTEITPGADLTYTIAYTNTSDITKPVPGAAYHVVFTDTLPANVTYRSCAFVPASAGTCTHVGNSVRFERADPLVAGAGGQATVTVNVNADTRDQITNEVALTYRDGLGDPFAPTYATDRTMLKTERPSALVATKQDRLVLDNNGDGLANTADVIEYTLTVTNTGTEPVTTVSISDPLDPYVTLVEDSLRVEPQPSLAAATLVRTDRGNEVGLEIQSLSGNNTSVSLVFHVTVNSDLPASVTKVVNQGIVTSDQFPALLTDDPDTPAPFDATETSVTATPSDAGSTAVTLTSFTVHTQAEGTVIQWSTSLEQQTLGFHIYRSSASKRTAAVRVTSALIPAQGRGSAGASYLWVDTTPDADDVTTTYWLQEVELTGAAREYGPVPRMLQAVRDPKLFLPLLR